MRRLMFALAVFVVLVGVAQSHGAIVTAHVEVTDFTGTYSFVPLELGESLSTIHGDRAVWYEFPAALTQQPFHIFQGAVGEGNVDRGIVSFAVLTDGPVLMACTKRWASGGSAGDDWTPELTSKAELLSQGWVEFAEPMLTIWPATGAIRDEEFVVFKRDSVAGEAFRYRTEKYIPPHLLTTQYVEDQIIPEPASLLIWSLLGGLGFGAGWWSRRKAA